MSGEPLAFDQYLRQVTDLWLAQHTQRRGQMFFNALVRIRPKLAEQVRGTDLDPFHQDRRVPEFLRFVEDHWWDRP